MRIFFKKYKYSILTGIFIVAVLTAAFFSGGEIPTENNRYEPSVSESVTELGTVLQTEKQNVTTGQTAAEQDSSTTKPKETKESKAAEAESSSQLPETAKPKEQETVTSKLQEAQTTPQRPRETKDTKETQAVTKRPQQTQEKTTKVSEPSKAEQTTCTISISCRTALDNVKKLEPAKAAILPSDGWILSPVTVSFEAGESVFDLLKRVCREQKIPMEFSWTPIYNSAYIEGIYNLYEFDCGSTSGWMYSVNGVFPNYGCSAYEIKNGDVITWQYTCNLGNDIGGKNAVN